jgi:LPS-assembly lipoprotein
MMKLPLILTALFMVLCLAACGFHPVYGVNKYTAVGAETKLAAVQIGNIPDREGQYLRNALIDRFYRDGRPQNATYSLKVDPISESTRDLDITIDADSTRGQLKLATNIKLVELGTGKIMLERKVQSITSYNILASEFTNRVSEQNTRENALDDLARQIENFVVLYFKRTE